MEAMNMLQYDFMRRAFLAQGAQKSFGFLSA